MIFNEHTSDDDLQDGIDDGEGEAVFEAYRRQLVDLAALRSELARLREALERIERDGHQRIDSDPCQWCGNRRSRDLLPHTTYCPAWLARAALSPKETP